MSVVEGLRPEKVFFYFKEITKIPHGSGNIEQLSDYLVEFAKERKIFFIQDALKNVIMIKEAYEGYEEIPPIILQGHIDMVAVKKPGAAIDMQRDSLCLKREGDYLYAEDTSLGGDDGIAVAYALAILDSQDIPHPKLEVIFTVDEETGMDGARDLDVSMLKGKRMLNLDSEEEGILLAGCAGGARVDWNLPIKRITKSGMSYCVSIKGLLGGHSGTEIDKERGNANALMGRLLSELSTNHIDACISQLEGGLADNAIPRETKAIFTVDSSQEKEFRDVLKCVENEIKKELQTKDAGFYLSIEKLPEAQTQCLDKESMETVEFLIYCAPSGVQAMSADIAGLAETSLNMGILKLEKDSLKVQFSVRSSLESSKKALILKLECMAKRAGATQEIRGDYPGWAYKKESPFRDMAVEVYRRIYGNEPKIEAIHAGLECGLLSAKITDLECISIGPDMKDIHTTEEKLSVSSTERVWNYVLEILKEK